MPENDDILEALEAQRQQLLAEVDAAKRSTEEISRVREQALREYEKLLDAHYRFLDTKDKRFHAEWVKRLKEREKAAKESLGKIIGLAEVERRELAKTRNLEIENAKHLKDTGQINAKQLAEYTTRVNQEMNDKIWHGQVSRMMGSLQMAREIVNTITNIPAFQAISGMMGGAGRAALALGGAGVDVTARGGRALTGEAFETQGFKQAFSRLSGIMTEQEQLAIMQRLAREAPRSIADAQKGLVDLIGTMANFGFSIEDTTDALIKGSRQLNFGQRDLSTTTLHAAALQKQLGVNTVEATQLLLDMSTQLRGVGADSFQATSILASFSKDMEAFGQQISQVEIQDLAARMAAGFGNIPLGRQLGLMQFTTGTAIQGVTRDDIKNFVTRPLENARKIYQQIQIQTGQSAAEQLITAQKVGELVGISVTSARDAEYLRQVFEDGNLTEAQMEKRLKDLGDPAKMTAKGIAKLVDTIAPIQRMEKHLENIYTAISPFARMGVAPAVGGAMRAAGDIGMAGIFMSDPRVSRLARRIPGMAGLAAGARMIPGAIMRLGATVVTGTGMAAASPYIAGAAAIGAVTWAGYELHEAMDSE